MRDDGGLAPLESGLHNAAFTVLATLVAVHVAEMDFHPRDPIAESVQGTLHHAFNMGGELLAPFDVAIRTDLDLHLRLRFVSAQYPVSRCATPSSMTQLEFCVALWMSASGT